LETGRITIPQINTNLNYLVARIIVCVQNSEGFVNYKLSYRMETILSTDERPRQRHNIIRPQNVCGHIKIGSEESVVTHQMLTYHLFDGITT